MQLASYYAWHAVGGRAVMVALQAHSSPSACINPGQPVLLAHWPIASTAVLAGHVPAAWLAVWIDWLIEGWMDGWIKL